jgi:ribosomal protein S18 acetylase RimI-like enzyme
METNLEIIKAGDNNIKEIKQMIYDYWYIIEDKYEDKTNIVNYKELILPTIKKIYPIFEEGHSILDDNIYILFCQDQIAGFVSFGIYKNVSELFIYDLYIKEKFQRLGFGTVLINFAKNIASESSLYKLGLWVDEKNIIAKTLYSKLDFEFCEYNEIKWYNEVGQMSAKTKLLYLVKQLN